MVHAILPDDIVLVDETREGINMKLDIWRRAVGLGKIGVELYLGYKFNGK